MSKFHLLSIVFFVSGIVFFAFGLISGEVETGFIFVFPFLIGSGIYAFLGFVFIFIAILLFMFGFVSSVGLNDFEFDIEDKHYSRRKSSVKGGGIVFIGPIPIAFGSNWKIAIMMIILAIVILLVSFFVFKIR